MELKQLKIGDKFWIPGNPDLKHVGYEVTGEVSNCSRLVWNHTCHRSEVLGQYTKVIKIIK